MIMPKCKIKMADKIRPVEGSVKGPEGKRTGTCPECNTPGVMLSIVGEYIRTHTVSDTETPENNPTPPMAAEAAPNYGKGLREPVTDNTDTSLRIGDPKAAEQRRVAELGAGLGTGTVEIPVKVPGEGTTKSGKPRMVTKMTPVPATEENIRKALAHWKGKAPRTDASRQKQRDTLATLFRMLEALHKGAEAFNGVIDKASVARGPALVPGRPTAPRLRDPELPWSEPTDIRRNGQVRKSTTLDQPRGRDRFDRKITDVPEPPRKRTAAEKRRYRREQALRRKMARQSNKG